jgi:hypothetical protein
VSELAYESVLGWRDSDCVTDGATVIVPRMLSASVDASSLV